MKKRRKPKISATSNPVSDENFNTPFAGLDELLKQGEVQPSSSSEEVETEKVGLQEEEHLFREAMTGVETMTCNTVEPRKPGPLAKPSRRPMLEEELEAYAQLVDLVSGDGSFDNQYTDEYIEGAVAGTDPELLPKLRRGDFSIQAHFDLHGMTAGARRASASRSPRCASAR